MSNKTNEELIHDVKVYAIKAKLASFGLDIMGWQEMETSKEKAEKLEEILLNKALEIVELF